MFMMINRRPVIASQFSSPCSSGSPLAGGFGEARLPLSTLSEFRDPLSLVESVFVDSNLDANME